MDMTQRRLRRALPAIMLAIALVVGLTPAAPQAALASETASGVVGEAAVLDTVGAAALDGGGEGLAADETPAGAVGEAAEADADEASVLAEESSVATLSISGTELYDYAYQVLDIVNQERAAEGLASLTMDADLLEAAMQRAAETAIYWDHTRPNGTSCFTVLNKTMSMMGENIAAGQGTPTSVMNSWMNSSGHRANILESSYKSIGIGCFRTSDGTLRWVQLFGSSTASATSGQSDVTTTREVQVDLTFFEPSFTVSVDATVQSDWICLDLGQSTTPTIYLTNSGWGRPAVENSSFTWESSNTAHVSATSSGTISAIADGTATVTLSLGWNRYAMRVLAGYTPNSVYSDVDGHWGEGWAMAATEAGLMTGYSNTSGVPTGVFGIEDIVTRAQLATILYRHANPDSDATENVASYENNETDMSDVVSKQYYTAAINWAYENGIMTGDTDTEGNQLFTMRPNDSVSRQEAATMIARYAAFCGVDTSADPSAYESAPDADAVLPFAQEAVAWCYENGIMTGDANTGYLMPQSSTTRAQMAKIAVVSTEIIG